MRCVGHVARTAHPFKREKTLRVCRFAFCSPLEFRGHNSPLVQTPALRACGNIVTGDDQQTQARASSGLVRRDLCAFATGHVVNVQGQASRECARNLAGTGYSDAEWRCCSIARAPVRCCICSLVLPCLASSLEATDPTFSASTSSEKAYRASFESASPFPLPFPFSGQA